jgi:signal transduction histidine kinase
MDCLYTWRMSKVSPSQSPPESEAHWVESESIQRLMIKVIETQLLAFASMTLMVAMLYGYTSTAALLTWYALNALFSLIRVWFLSGYRGRAQTDQQTARDLFFSRHDYLLPLSGFIWGFSAYLFFDKVPPTIASCCLLIVAMYGVFSTSALANHLSLFKRFLLAYALGLMAAIGAQVVLDKALLVESPQIWFTVMVTVFVLLLKRVGERLNRTHTKSIKLQHRNTRLIASLTQQREAALSAVATKNRLLASAAHDMRQPILALDIYADWLMSEPRASAELSPKISAATKAVIALFDSLFDLAKLIEGQMSAEVKRISINALVEDLMMQYQPIANAKQLSIETRLLDGYIWTDPILLKRILGNLISNAIKYTQTGGILVVCRKTQRGISFAVWDTGVGIARDQQDLVFREFYKGSANVGTSDGFGLGLAIVTQLSELLGCKLTLKSRLGRGTVVTIRFNTSEASHPGDASRDIALAI